MEAKLDDPRQTSRIRCRFPAALAGAARLAARCQALQARSVAAGNDRAADRHRLSVAVRRLERAVAVRHRRRSAPQGGDPRLFRGVQSGCAQATGAGPRLALCAAEAFRPRRRAVSDRRVRRPRDGARSWARAPHHARRRSTTPWPSPSTRCGLRRGRKASASAGCRSSIRGRSPRSWRCREIGLSSGIFASAIRRRSTIRPRFSAPIGSAGTLRRGRSFIVRDRARLESPPIKLHSVL